MELMERNFVFWGWDLTYEANKTFLQNSISNCLGTTAMHSLRNIPVEKLPAIIIIMKIRSSTDIVSVVYGKVIIFTISSVVVVTNEYCKC